MVEEKKKEKLAPEGELAADIQKKVTELNALLVEVKKNSSLQVSIRSSGAQVKPVGMVNQIAINVIKTEVL